MFCSECGYKLDNKSKFCPNCGKAILIKENDIQIKTVLLQCKTCGGELQIDHSREVVVCPYCGGKELIIENDQVRIERLKSNAYRDVELGKQQAEVQMKKMAIEEKDRESKQYMENKKKGLFMMLGSLIVFILCVEFQFLFGGGMRLIITIVCMTMLIYGFSLLVKKRKK